MLFKLLEKCRILLLQSRFQEMYVLNVLCVINIAEIINLYRVCFKSMSYIKEIIYWVLFGSNALINQGSGYWFPKGVRVF